MRVPRRLVVVCAGATLVILGLGLGAQLQDEGFIDKLAVKYFAE